MKKRIISAGIATVMIGNAVLSGTGGSINAVDYYDMEINVNFDEYRKPVSPYIFGVNSDFRKEEYLYDATAFSARQGGNRFSGYNWETNYSNAGADYYHYSDQYLVDYDKELLAVPGGPAIEFAQEATAKNVPYKVTTVQMAGYVSADDGGEVTEGEIAPSARWKEVKARKGSEFSMTPDKTDDYVYMDEYVNYLVNTLGDATTKTGYQAYNLDNEPALWSSTHARMHPEKTTCEEIVSKSIEYSSAIKDVDPNAEIFGLALFGMGAYTTFSGAPDWSEHSDEYNWFISYYLDEMRKAEEEYGKRLIDVIDVHYYSEAKGQCRVTVCEDPTHTECIEARLQAPRTLFDPMYIETSWIGDSLQGYLPVLPTINESIEKYYPGTKVALTEYNFGGGNHVSGAVATADALGVFAENDVFMANLWAINSDFSYQRSAIELYTDYDGKGAHFGDTLISSETEDISKASSYASINGSDESKLNIVVTNKSITETQKATINLNTDTQYSSAKIYGITGDSSEIQLLDTVSDINDNSFTVEIPAVTVVQIEVLADEDYTIAGDVNSDGNVNEGDLEALQNYLLCREGAVITAENSDVAKDSIIDVFDLTVLRNKLSRWSTPEESEKIVAYWPTKTGQWRIKNGMSSKTITLTFTGEAGNQMNLAYGYWDSVAVNPNTGNAGVWFNNDDTYVGWFTFDENGKADVTLKVPDNCSSLEMILFNYVELNSDGTKTQLDKSLVGLEKVIENE